MHLPTNYFALFGVNEAFLQCDETLKTRYLLLMQQCHPDRYVDATPQAKRLAVEFSAAVNHAYRTLRTPLLRAMHLLTLRGESFSEDKVIPLSPDFLMEQMELREALSEDPHLAREAIDKAVNELHRALEKHLDTVRDNQQALIAVQKLQFYSKLQEEALVC